MYFQCREFSFPECHRNVLWLFFYDYFYLAPWTNFNIFQFIIVFLFDEIKFCMIFYLYAFMFKCLKPFCFHLTTVVLIRQELDCSDVDNYRLRLLTIAENEQTQSKWKLWQRPRTHLTHLTHQLNNTTHLTHQHLWILSFNL